MVPIAQRILCLGQRLSLVIEVSAMLVEMVRLR